MPMSLFEQHYQALQHLDNGVKIQIIEQLQKDVYQKPVDKFLQYPKLSQLKPYSNIAGDNDDLHMIGMADYIAISNDETDENWLTNLQSFIANNVAVSDLPYSEHNRGWTRDELYE